MAEIHVIPAALRHAGSHARRLGGEVSAVGGDARALANVGDGAPSGTGVALERFHATWSAGVGQMGHALSGLGLTTEVAASLYEETDAGVVPGS